MNMAKGLGLAPNEAGPEKLAALKAAEETYRGYRPQNLQARQQAVDNAFSMFQPANNMLGQMYGQGAMVDFDQALRPLPGLGYGAWSVGPQGAPPGPGAPAWQQDLQQQLIQQNTPRTPSEIFFDRSSMEGQGRGVYPGLRGGSGGSGGGSPNLGQVQPSNDEILHGTKKKPVSVTWAT